MICSTDKKLLSLRKERKQFIILSALFNEKSCKEALYYVDEGTDHHNEIGEVGLLLEKLCCREIFNLIEGLVGDIILHKLRIFLIGVNVELFFAEKHFLIELIVTAVGCAVKHILYEPCLLGKSTG